MSKSLTIEHKPKRGGYREGSGKNPTGINTLDTSIAVSKVDKETVAELRDYLNKPNTRDIVLDMLNEIRRIAATV